MILSWLVEPLKYGFMQRGLAAAIIIGILCAVVGCYVVLRSMAFLGDALAHAILPGVAVAYLLGGSLIVGALVAAIIVALSIGFFSKGGTIREDTAIGILFAAALSLGVALISSIRTYAVDLSHILFGNILGVSSSDLWGVIVLVGPGAGDHDRALPPFPGGFFRSCPGENPAFTRRRPAEFDVDPVGGHDRGLHADRGDRPGSRDVGYAGGGGLPADPPPAHDDGRGGGHWRIVQRGRPVFKLLP